MSGAQFEPLDPSKIRPLVELPEEFVQGILADREKQRHVLNRALLMGEKGIAPVNPIKESVDVRTLTTVTTRDKLEAALAYAKLGFDIFPLHSLQEDGRCTCGEACPFPGKHPRGLAGPFLAERATTEVAQIRRRWEEHPDSNIATPVGQAWGLAIMDVDIPDGESTLERWVQQNGPLPPHVVARSPSGGKHIYYGYPAGVARYESRVLGPDLEIRADTPPGGASAGRIAWAILPPSTTTGSYRWHSPNRR